VIRPYDELFGFDGSEFYTRVFPEATGMQFGSLLGHFKTSILVGVKHASGDVVLAPPNEYA